MTTTEKQLDVLIARQAELHDAMLAADSSFGTPAFAALRRKADENHVVLVDLYRSIGGRPLLASLPHVRA